MLSRVKDNEIEIEGFLQTFRFENKHEFGLIIFKLAKFIMMNLDAELLNISNLSKTLANTDLSLKNMTKFVQ